MTYRMMIVVAAALAAFGCGDDPMDVNEGEPADGEVGGESWNFIAGGVTSVLEDDGFSSVVLADFSLRACQEMDREGLYVQFSVPTGETGTHSSIVTMTRIDGIASDSSFSEGEVEITEWGDGVVYGSIDFRHDDHNWVDGDFAARICD